MPLWSRIALVAAVLVLSAVGMASTLQAFIGRRAVLEQARSGALGIADVLARAAAFAEEVPAAVEAEIGEQMLTQARLVAQLVAVAETAGLSRDEILSRLRNVAGRSGMSLVASDETGLAVYQTDAVAGEFRFSKDPTLQPQAHVFHRLLDGDLPSVVQDARKREIDDLVYKYVGVQGVDRPRVVQVGLEATFFERLDRVLGLRRMVADLVGGDVREVRILDSRMQSLVSGRASDNGMVTDTQTPLDSADESLIRECVSNGRPTGRVVGDHYRVAAPVRRADGRPAGAVIVSLVSRSNRDLLRWQGNAAIVSALVVGLPAVLGALWLAREIARPVQQSMVAAESIAAGDLTGILPEGGSGETGRLLGAFGRMSVSLRDLVSRIQAAGDRLSVVEADASTALARQERVIKNFSGSAAEVSSAVSEISATSEQLLVATSDVTDIAREAARVADQGRDGLESMTASMQQLDEAMNAFTRKLSTISQRAGGITVVVTTIAKVADQTNLLSVNATIEAEKAGESGRGFRIVAQEIRRLADQTALATKDIERMVRDMQSAVSSGTMEMDRFRNEVSQRIAEVSRVSEHLGRILAPVQSVTRSLETVHEGMETQSMGARQIRDAMERLRTGAVDSASATGVFASSLGELRRSIRELNDQVARFRTSPDPTEG